MSTSDVSIAPYAERIAVTSLTKKQSKVIEDETEQNRGEETMTFTWQLKGKDNSLEFSDMLSEISLVYSIGDLKAD